jgi:16S rRNA processing protein RimM
MNYLLVGKIYKTHGIKGEIKIISYVENSNLIYKVGSFIYVSEEHEKFKIISYRRHKNYDMVVLDGYNYINDVLRLLGKKVYIDRDNSILKDKLLNSDLIGFTAYYNEENIGYINEIINNNGYKLFNINNKLIPYNENFILNIDISNKKIIFRNLEGLL